MFTLRFLVFVILLFLSSLVTSLPVAEDSRKSQSAVDNLGGATSTAYSSVDSPPDSLTRRADRQLPTFESGQEGGASSLAHSLGLSPPVSEAKVEQKRDDIRQYDNPRPWTVEEYRALYLAGLARIAREGGGKNKDRRSSPDLQPGSLMSKANVAKKRKVLDKSAVLEDRENNDSKPVVEDWGISYEDYQRFYNHNLTPDYGHWTLEEWQNFIDRYLEFVASGGQVGKGDRKRDDMRKHDHGLFDDKLGNSWQDWHILQEWLRRNGHQKRDKVDQYNRNMTDEDGRGGEDDDEKDRWEILQDLDVWAVTNGYGMKQKRSLFRPIIRENSYVAPAGMVREIWDSVPASTTSNGVPSSAKARNLEDRDNVNQYGKNLSEEDLMITDEEFQYLYSIYLLHYRLLKGGNKKLHRKQFRKPSPFHAQRRDDIRQYGKDITDDEWARMWGVRTGLEAERLLDEDNNPKIKREAAFNYQDNVDFEHLSMDDVKELHRIALADPAFLEFQKQYIAGHSKEDNKQIRSPALPDIHQTAPVHSGPPHAGTNHVAAGNWSTTSNSSSGNASSSAHPPAREKRDDIRHYDEFMDEGSDDNFEVIDGHVEEPPMLVPLQPEGVQPRYYPDPMSLPDFPHGTTISDVVAAEEASRLADEASVQEKRDNMYRYGGGLDDWDDFVLNSLYCEGLECPESRRRAEASSKQRRDSMDKYDKNPEEWEDYSALLKAMEEGSLPSFFHPRSHPRDLSNFPSWIPSEDPAPPNIEPEASSKKSKRDNSGDRRDLTNFPSWTPADNPVPPEIVQGAASSKKQKRDDSSQNLNSVLSKSHAEKGSSSQDSMTFRWRVSPPARNDHGRPELPKRSLDEALYEDGHINNAKGKRDKVDQYNKDMMDEDEWIDIYRLYYLSRQRQRAPSTNVGGRMRQRRAPGPVPEPEPDTVVVRPLESGLRQIPRPTTVKDGVAPATTRLISLDQASPGPGTPRTHTPSAAPSPTSLPSLSPSALFYPFGPWLSVGPNQPAQSADPRRREGDKLGKAAAMVERDGLKFIPKTQEDWDIFDAWLIREHDKNPGHGRIKERRALIAPASPPITSPPVTSPSTQSLPPKASPTQLQNPEGAATPPDISNDVTNVVEGYGPLLNLASALSPLSTTPAPPSAGSTNATAPAKEKRDSMEKYTPSSSIEHWDDDDWEAFDNYVTFQEADGPNEKRQTLDCLEFNADSAIDLPAGCLCPGSTEALPKANLRRDDMGQYEPAADEEAAIYEWVMTGRYRDGGGKPRGKRGTGTSDATAGQETGVQESQQQEGQQEEQQQHQEGVEQGIMEQGGGKLRMERRREWVPEEDELTEGLPEGAGNGKAKRAPEPVQLATTAEGGEVGRRDEAKRHCGRADLPEGYGNNETVLCG